MATYFKTIAEAKKYAREQAILDEENWLIAWHVDGARVIVNGTYTTRYVAAMSEPEAKYQQQTLAKTTFSRINYEGNNKLTMELDEKMWNQIADMLDMRSKELDNLTNEEVILLDELQKRGY